MRIKIKKRRGGMAAGGLVLSVLLLFAALWLKTEIRARAEELAISDTTVILYLGDGGVSEHKLSVSGLPKGAKATYRSKSAKIASVGKSSGKITAKGAGKTTIICTVTLADGSKKEFKTTVRVRDDIKEIKLSAGKGIRANALRLSTDYPLAYSCKTVAGTDKNTSNSLYYEVVTAKGGVSPDAAVTDGVFRASKCGTYFVNVYVFQTEGAKNKWLSDRKKYEKSVLASDSLELTVTIKKFKVQEVKNYGWSMELPPSYKVSANKDKDGGVTFGISALTREKLTSVSNIRVMVDPLTETGDVSDLKHTMETVYTKKTLEDSWKTAYHAKSADISGLLLETEEIGGKQVVTLSYEVELKNIKLTQETAADIEIASLAFYNTIYTWYDGSRHVTVNVTDAVEAIQPNISEAAEKLVESMVFTGEK